MRYVAAKMMQHAVWCRMALQHNVFGMNTPNLFSVFDYCSASAVRCIDVNEP